MSGLNVVALISGGKDSFFSILHCQRNGHQIIALANLYPSSNDGEADIEDSESYMYQTIGHAVIPQYQDALQLPLFRQRILGFAVNQAKSYGPASPGSLDTLNELDETESLIPLLRRVTKAHPEVNAVSTGAIMSDYQRTRVESVALRLGLVPLSYLWQWPFLAGHSKSSLLQDMSMVGQDARIVKVASGGLDDSFLWQNVADARTITRLSSAARRFGSADDGAVLGEGGEYETLCIAGPPPLWKGRIVIAPESLQTVPGEAGSASIRILESSVVPNADHSASVDKLPLPPLLDSQFQHIVDRLAIDTGKRADESHSKASFQFQEPAPAPAVAADSIEQEGSASLLPALTGEGSTASEQTHSIMIKVVARLSAMGLRESDIAYTTIILREMHDFVDVNDAYRTYFVEPNPAARLTIACAGILPASSLLMMSVTAANGPREGLHVQSRSYWAPANIGPYSQAIRFPQHTQSAVLDATVFVSGQIALVPASTDLYHPSGVSPLVGFLHEAVLSLQHLMRIGKTMKVLFWSSTVVFIATSEDSDIRERIDVVRNVWRAYSDLTAACEESLEEDEGEGFDVWHMQNRQFTGKQHAAESDEASGRGILLQGGLTAILVDSLPRGAAIEWVGTGKHAQMDAVSSELFHLKDVIRTFKRLPGTLHKII
jgi:diphthine-ammonia ligase